MSTDFVRDTDTSRCSFPNRREEVVSKYNLRDSYRIVSWVYACINAIADAIAGVPLNFYSSPPDGDNPAKLPEGHQIYQLFNPPKPGETPTFEDFIRQIYINLGIFGEIFSPLEFEGATPKNIPVRNPYLFEAKLDNRGDIKNWKMEKYSAQGGTSGEKITVAPR